MPTRFDDDDDLPDTGSRDREISLGTGTVLAIFLALALVCSLFFGLGYSMGRKSSPAGALTSGTRSSLPLSDEPATTPSQGQLDPQDQHAQPASESSAAASRPQISVRTADTPAAHTRPSTATQVRESAATAAKPSASTTLPTLPVPMPATPNADPGVPQTFVQVAAVSRREDADLLLTALKRRGYTGLIRQQPQDKLLHVQLGPFPNKKEAEAMRQRLITDGYNPILK